MGFSLSELYELVTGKVITGGRRTKAVGVREVLNSVIGSYLNLKDGGNVVEALAGYATNLTPSDDKHFATKKYVDDNAGGGGDILNGGNSFTADASIGTNDAFDLLFRAGNANRGGVTDTAEWMFGVTSPFSNTHKSNKSLGNTSGSYAEQWQNSDADVIAWLRNDGLFNAVNGYSQGSNVLLQESGSRVMMGSLTDAKGIDVYTGGIKVMWADYADFLNFDNTSGVIFKRNGSECLRFTSDGTDNVMLAQVPFYNNSDNYKTADLFQRKLYGNWNIDESFTVADTKSYYIGDSATNGSWRTRIDAGDFVVEKRESGTWVEKQRFS